MLEPRFTVAVAVYAFASNNRTRGFLRIDKSDHAQLGWVPETAGRCDSIKDTIGGQLLALVQKQAIDPRSGPRMLHVIDRQSVVLGNSVLVRFDHGGIRNIKQKTKIHHNK